MAPTKKQQEPLARVNFPMYSIQMVTNRHVLVGGGGGSPNSGVKNGFEILEVMNDGHRYVSELVMRHLTGPNAVMNCAVHNTGKRIYLAAGQESHCQLYTLDMQVVNVEGGEKEDEGAANNVRQRKKAKTSTPAKPDLANGTSKHVTFMVRTNDSVQTDFCAVEPLQKVARISPDNGKLLVTGGTDGHVRVWRFPQMQRLFDIEAHTREADDLDISPDGKQVVSLSKDNTLVAWSLETGKQTQAFTWKVPDGAKYLLKRCRYGPVEDAVGKTRLFALTNPVGKPGRLKSQLQLWDTADAQLKKMSPYNESVSALAVSDNGRFVAVGTMGTGSVCVHIAFSLQRVLYVPSAHSMFVTGLAFLPTRGAGPPVTGESEMAVVSISVDNRVCIHSLPFRRSVPVWVAVVMIVVLLFLAFVLCSFVGI